MVSNSLGYATSVLPFPLKVGLVLFFSKPLKDVRKLANFFFHIRDFNSAEEESVRWGPVLASLQVPELTVDDFLSESQSGGSFLTLYAFILQRLNSEYTAANERRTLALINTWTNQVFPRFVPFTRSCVACSVCPL